MFETRETVDVGTLVSAWERQSIFERQKPWEILFPHLAALQDSDVQVFYEGLRARGYQGNSMDSVHDVNNMHDIYHLITKMHRKGFI